MAQPKLTLDQIRRSDPFAADANLGLSSFPYLNPLADAPLDDEKFAPELLLLSRRVCG